MYLRVGKFVSLEFILADNPRTPAHPLLRTDKFVPLEFILADNPRTPTRSFER